ncbi:MAG: hypothetical protein ABL973_11000 [Micropepsaceae bacterium]
MEKQFVDLVGHVFTLQWASWAIPVSLLFAFMVRRLVPALLVSLLAVVIHHAGPVVLPALLGGEGFTTILKDVSALAPKLEPISIAAEYLAYVYLIVVFSLTRRDMFRPSAQE